MKIETAKTKFLKWMSNEELPSQLALYPLLPLDQAIDKYSLRIINRNERVNHMEISRRKVPEIV